MLRCVSILSFDEHVKDFPVGMNLGVQLPIIIIEYMNIKIMETVPNYVPEWLYQCICLSIMCNDLVVTNPLQHFIFSDF